MAETEDQEDEKPKKRSIVPFLVGVILALVLGGGGFVAVWSGMILAPSDQMEDDAHVEEDVTDFLPLPDVVFVPVKPLVVNIGAGSQSRHLRFQAQLEVRRGAESDVEVMLPRVIDVLNGYLRAVDASELEQRTALARLRAQMLRRVQVVTGEDRVRDLLIMEFVLN